MKVKIVSDGTINGTRVVNAETGEVIENATKVDWGHNAGDIPYATITIFSPEVEVEVKDPHWMGEDLSWP